MKHIVGFSGGVDSQACARWVLNRFPPEDVVLTNSTAGGWEDPLTIQFVADYSTRVHPVVIVPALVRDAWETEAPALERGLDPDAELTFQQLVAIKGRAPSRTAQFCTEILKLKPQRRWVRQAFGVGGMFEGQEYCRYKGVRREESNARKATLPQAWDDYFDCDTFCPLFDWTKQMCFDYVQAHGEEVNPLYRLGFNRVGCAPCINSSKADVVNWATRRPEAIDKVRELEAATGRTFFYPVRRDSVITPIDEVVLWARTSRGGRQLMLEVFTEREGCESKYGLCE